MHLSVTTWSPEVVRGRAMLLHGITGSAAGWWRVAEHLVGRGFAVTAPDLRGHGNSPRPPTGYAFDDLVADLAAVAPTVDLLVGHSFGATLAVVGVTGGALSARRTVLEDPVLTLGTRQAAAVAEAEIAWRPRDVESLVAEHPGWDRRDIAGRVLAHYQLEPAAVRLAWTDNAPWDLVPVLRETAARTKLLVVVPELSPYNDRRSVDLLIDRLGRRCVLQVGGGHSVHRERYATFAAMLDGVIDA